MDPRKTLTEEVPESPADFRDRNLTEIDGKITVAPARVLTEVPFDEDEEEEEDSTSNLLLG